MDILNQHLIPDLTQLVLKYCWSENCNFHDLCFYGNYKKISTIENNDWNWGLYHACGGGHMNIVKLIIEKMTGNPISDTETLGSPNWNNGLHHACYGGHMHIVELMIERGATGCYCREDNCLYQRLKN